MDPMGLAINSAIAQSDMAQAQTQMAMQVSLQKQSLNFEASMTQAILSGGQENRDALLAMQGIGQKLNCVA